MRFKVDENLPVEIANSLREARFDASTVDEQHLGGCHDYLLARKCRKEGRILVTFDLDFANIQEYPPGAYPGFIVLRLRRQEKPFVIRAWNRVMRMMSSESAARKLWIVEEGRVRIRD